MFANDANVNWCILVDRYWSFSCTINAPLACIMYRFNETSFKATGVIWKVCTKKKRTLFTSTNILIFQSREIGIRSRNDIFIWMTFVSHLLIFHIKEQGSIQKSQIWRIGGHRKNWTFINFGNSRCLLVMKKIFVSQSWMFS